VRSSPHLWTQEGAHGRLRAADVLSIASLLIADSARQVRHVVRLPGRDETVLNTKVWQSAVGMTRDRWRTNRGTRRLAFARFWWAEGDLDRAAAQITRAANLVEGCGNVSVSVAVACTAAVIARDRARYAEAEERWKWALRSLPRCRLAAQLTDGRAQVLVGLADAHRRVCRYPEAIALLSDAMRLIETGGGVDVPNLRCRSN
jgi:tetratricopeptide (TPR) repeat protein